MDMLNWWKGMENALDAASLRQQVIANNIANAGSPNFKAQRVAFEEEMQKAYAAKQGEEGLDVRPVGMEDDGDFKIGGAKNSWEFTKGKLENTEQKVDIHQEMVNLAKNQMYYNMVSDKMGGMIKGLMGVIDQLERR
jgi:flagellar basal-body rod protein FlgB